MASIWIPDYPVPSTVMSGSTEQIRTNWDIIENWWDVEHDPISAATSGDHPIGQVGALLVADTATISALSSPGTGAMALDTSLGEFQIYSSAGYWNGITDTKFARIRQGFGVQSIPASTWTKVACAASTEFYGAYDALSAWSNYKYTVAGTGYYFLSASLSWPYSTSLYNKGVCIAQNTTPVAVAKRHGNAVRSLIISDIIYLSAADYIEVYAWHNHTSAVVIDGGSLHVMRVS